MAEGPGGRRSRERELQARRLHEDASPGDSLAADTMLAAPADARRGASRDPLVVGPTMRSGDAARVELAATVASQARDRGDPLDQTRVAGHAPASARAVDQLDHYRIQGELGRGGMGVVYVAEDTMLGRQVAIKQLQVRGDSLLRERLLREARAMAKLSHPNVVPVYEIGEVGESTFIVMEYIEGVTLRRWLADAPRTLSELLGVFKDAARGLIAAHDKELVHRDFKPDNVMIGADGRVRVMDFGLARSEREELGEPVDAVVASTTTTTASSSSLRASMSTHPSLTMTGALLGTPAYMSPEQHLGQRADVASDQFSYCVALFEALYDARPFAGETLGQLRAATLRGDVRATPRGAAVPLWLRRVVLRGLRVAPEERHESMRALLAAIEAGEAADAANERAPPDYVFVAHDRGDALLVRRLCEELLDRGVRPWLDMWELDPDADWRAPLEAALRDAPAVLVCHGARGWDPEHEYAAALRARVEREPASVLRVGLPGAARRHLPVSDRAEGVDLDEADWAGGLDQLAALVGVDPRRADWLEREARRQGVAADSLSPYRGLQAFRERDARWMFGREAEVEDLLSRIRDGETRFLTLIGASGSGKSSLVLAGVCPALRAGVLGGGRDWSIVTLRPGRSPCDALARALVMMSSEGEGEGDDDRRRARLRDELLADGGRLRAFARARGGASCLLVIDQLEELFTEARLEPSGEPRGAMAFVDNLVNATRDAGGAAGGLWVLATLRADFVQRCLEVGALARALRSGTYFALPPMGERQLRVAIERPARRVGYRVEPALLEKLVSGAAEQAGRLPLLQHVLRELWQRRDRARRLLSFATYEETGGIEGAIAFAAERALDELRAELGLEATVATRRLMTRLVHLGGDTSGDTRRRARADELGEDPATRRVLDALIGRARVLVATEQSGVEYVEIAHEALLREWSTLVVWLNADRDALRLRQALARDAAQWRARGEREFLWGRARVEEARRVLAASVVSLNDHEHEFLEQSERVVRARARRARLAIAGLLALAAAIVIVVLQKNAEIHAKSRDISEEKARVVEAMRALELERQTQRVSLSVQRGLRARMLIPEDREAEALALGVQAVADFAPDFVDLPQEAVQGLERVLAEDAIVVEAERVLRDHARGVIAVAYAPGGARFVTGSTDGTAKIWSAETGAVLHTLADDETTVRAVAFAPDGARVVTGGDSGVARLWDARTGALVARLEGHRRSVYSLAFSPGGERVATASLDGAARLWDARTGALQRVLEGHESVIRALAFSPDGARLATASQDKTARLWDVETGAALATMGGHGSTLYDVKFSPDGDTVATACGAGTAKLWDGRTGALRRTLEGHQNSVVRLAFSPAGERLATASKDGTTRVWSVDRGTLLAELRGHASEVHALAYAPDGRRIATASFDNTARLWDAETGAHLATLKGHESTGEALAYAPDGRRLVTTSSDGTARLWDATVHAALTTVRGHESELYGAVFSPDGRRVATVSTDATAKIWDAARGDRLLELRGHTNELYAVAYAPNGAYLATAGFDGTTRIWDAETGAPQGVLEVGVTVATLAFTPDSARVATGDFHGVTRVWSVETGAELVSMRASSAPIIAVAFTRDGARLATGSFDNLARVWDPSSGALVASMEGHTDDINHLAFSPDGAQLATASKDDTVRLWSSSSGAQQQLLRAHARDVLAVAYSPDGAQLASVGEEPTVYLWSPADGARLMALRGHEDWVLALAYAPDGTRIATGSRDGTAKIWDARGGELLWTLAGHAEDVRSVEFSPDGARLVTASGDRSAKIWDPARGELIATLGHRIGLARPDGSIAWPVPPARLIAIACERLAVFTREREALTTYCEPVDAR